MHEIGESASLNLSFCVRVGKSNDSEHFVCVLCVRVFVFAVYYVYGTAVGWIYFLSHLFIHCGNESKSVFYN